MTRTIKMVLLTHFSPKFHLYTPWVFPVYCLTISTPQPHSFTRRANNIKIINTYSFSNILSLLWAWAALLALTRHLSTYACQRNITLNMRRYREKTYTMVETFPSYEYCSNLTLAKFSQLKKQFQTCKQ